MGGSRNFLHSYFIYLVACVKKHKGQWRGRGVLRLRQVRLGGYSLIQSLEFIIGLNVCSELAELWITLYFHEGLLDFSHIRRSVQAPFLPPAPPLAFGYASGKDTLSKKYESLLSFDFAKSDLASLRIRLKMKVWIDFIS